MAFFELRENGHSTGFTVVAPGSVAKRFEREAHEAGHDEETLVEIRPDEIEDFKHAWAPRAGAAILELAQDPTDQYVSPDAA